MSTSYVKVIKKERRGKYRIKPEVTETIALASAGWRMQIFTRRPNDTVEEWMDRFAKEETRMTDEYGKPIWLLELAIIAYMRRLGRIHPDRIAHSESFDLIYLPPGINVC